MSKPMSEQMQKLAARYEKATGKKFNAKTNAWFALFKLTSGIARNALAVMGTAKSVTTGTICSAETGNGHIGEGSSDHEQ